jgi:hypothetical protein
VVGAGDPLADGQQRGELVAGLGRIPRLPGSPPAGSPAGGARFTGGDDHINFLGQYAFTRPPAPGTRPLRDPDSPEETGHGAA